MFMQILIHTPVFVWALLAGLLALGLLQTRDRQVSKPQVVALPAVLLGLGLWSMTPGFMALPGLGLLWLAALALGSAGGRRTPQQPGTIWLAAERRFSVPGSWIPMAFIMAIFVLRYAVGAGTTLHPEWRSTLSLQVPLALVFGLLAGLSMGRALGLLSLARNSRPTISAHA
jgi:hypothetical protein